MAVSQLHLQVNQDERTYDLQVTAVQDGYEVEVRGADANGEQIAEMRGTLPVGDLALVLQLLTSGAAALKEPGSRSVRPLEERRIEHPNASQPWTAEDDQRLKELAALPEASIGGLAEQLGRSSGSIRARLPRVGVTRELPSRSPA
ncbi:hypothetical protein GCM10010412_048590 [Nonomuraea recticatena]|uniref:Uncharacterized protein n=1 Tax=Nonomuraea recticatena TaxID=46178 RepID=A0ABN3S831_9ACTN